MNDNSKKCNQLNVILRKKNSARDFLFYIIVKYVLARDRWTAHKMCTSAFEYPNGISSKDIQPFFVYAIFNLFRKYPLVFWRYKLLSARTRRIRN